jgi:serine/threonine protein kinase
MIGREGNSNHDSGIPSFSLNRDVATGGVERLVQSALATRAYNRATAVALQLGTRFGPYEIQSAIGAGGMGEVYRARDTKLQRDVAIKVLPEALAHDTEPTSSSDRTARSKCSTSAWPRHSRPIHRMPPKAGFHAGRSRALFS